MFCCSWIFLCSQCVCGEKPRLEKGTVENKEQPACQLFLKFVSTSFAFGSNINCEIAFVSCDLKKIFLVNLFTVNNQGCKERLIKDRLSCLRREREIYSLMQPADLRHAVPYVGSSQALPEFLQGGKHCPRVSLLQSLHS